MMFDWEIFNYFLKKLQNINHIQASETKKKSQKTKKKNCQRDIKKKN